eukprot:gb/GEZJ01009074.1/.p3 GENE.gb/GEZJ01009074.1/~~gb/GEZJ01009074.1/.p3  ORF type:complete len:113 (+),score=10.05 gb/GEZJ01009074.1/:109-447(+)
MVTKLEEVPEQEFRTHEVTFIDGFGCVCFPDITMQRFISGLDRISWGAGFHAWRKVQGHEFHYLFAVRFLSGWDEDCLLGQIVDDHQDCVESVCSAEKFCRQVERYCLPATD